MKWNLTPDKKAWKNYKGEVFKGRMAKDLNNGDQYEIEEEGRTVLLTVEKKEVTKDYIVVTSIGGEING